MFEFRETVQFLISFIVIYSIIHNYCHLIRTYKITISIHHAVLYNTDGQEHRKYALKENTWFSGSVGMGFCGDFHRFFCGYWMGKGIEIQCPRQPCIER